MKFNLLLFILAVKLKAAAKKNADYKKHLGVMQIKVLIRTADGKIGRLFIFDKGTFATETGDADTFRAAAQGKVRIEGMVPYLQWFTDGVKLAMK